MTYIRIFLVLYLILHIVTAQEESCATDSDCASSLCYSETCYRGKCLSLGPVEKCCTLSEDCATYGDSYSCVDNQCIDQSCKTDKDCAKSICVSGRCDGQGSRALADCAHDDDCIGSICYPETCSDGKCEMSEPIPDCCLDDDDCLTLEGTFACVDNWCTDEPCDIPEDCSDGPLCSTRACEEGRCVSYPRICHTDRECEESVCDHTGKCVLDSRKCCLTDTDCPTGPRCTIRSCDVASGSCSIITNPACETPESAFAHSSQTWAISLVREHSHISNVLGAFCILKILYIVYRIVSRLSYRSRF